MENKDKRKQRILQIYSSIKKCNNEGYGVDKEKLIAIIGMEFGTSRRTSLEYINTLALTGKIIIKDGEYFVNA